MTVQDASPADRHADFVRGYAALQAGQPAAREHFDRSTSVLPELADYSLYYAAIVALRENDRATARSRLDRLLAEHPDSVWLGLAAVERGDLALADGDVGRASELFRLATATGDARSTPRATLGTVRVDLAARDLPRAYAQVSELRGSEPPVGEQARLLAEQMEAEGAAALGLTELELALAVARARLREGRLDEAADVVRPALAPGQPHQADAWLVLARIEQRRGAIDAARSAFGEAIAASTTAEAAGTARFERARMAWNRDDDVTAEADFRELLDRSPGHPQSAEALYALGRIEESRDRYAQAAALYEELARRFPDHTLRRESAWRAGFVRYLAGDHLAAASAFEQIGDDESLYWQARALDEAGRPEEARAILSRLRERSPAGYLAWWIDERVGPGDRDATQPSASDPAEVRAELPPLGGAAAYHYSRARILIALRLSREARLELAAVEQSTGPSPFLLGAYDEIDAFPPMIRLAIRLDGDSDPELAEYLYPRAYREEFERHGALADIDPLLLQALARQESLFDPAVRSSAGAHGVMQLMPRTASTVVGRTVETTSLENPDVNIEIGTRYLRSLIDQYEGRLVLAIAAYNAGPDAVARWQARAAGRSGDEFVELIGYRETRGYVKAVLRNYRTYRDLYGSDLYPAVRLF